MAFMIGMGAVCADFIFMAMAFAGVNHLLQLPNWRFLCRVVGGITLLFLSIALFFQSRKVDSFNRFDKKNLGNSFLIGFFIVLGKPVLIAFWAGGASLLLGYFPELHIFLIRLFFYAGFVVGSAVWFFILARLIVKRIRGFDEKIISTGLRIICAALLIVGILMLMGYLQPA